MNSIRISTSIKMPMDAVTQTFAFIARKGGGKSYGAMLLAEEMLDIHAQVIAIDVVGNWYGLRLAADGKGKGKDIYIFGGSHGDVPLVPHAGAQIAKLLVDKGISAILDISEFRKGDRKRFATDFAEEFFHLKKSQTSPCHIFVEEAQKLVPQITREPDEARMLGAYEDIIRLGRNYGIGCTLVSQRPQSINKEALSQTECLVVLQVNGRHERKALEEWVEEAGADRKLVGELPGLAVGEAYIWSPSWLRIFERTHLGQKTTFDSTATPKVGQRRKVPAKLSAMDLSALSDSMQQIVTEASENDPKALRLRIRQLEAELKKKQPTKVEPREVTKERRVEVQVMRDVDLRRLKKSLDQAEKIAGHLALFGVKIVDTVHVLRKAVEWKPTASPPPPRVLPPVIKTTSTVRELAKKIGAEDNGALRRGELRMLSVLAQGYPVKRTRAQLGTLSGFTPSGGTYATYFGNLKRNGYITEGHDGSIEITDKGIEQVGGLDTLEPETPEDTLNRWRRALRKGEVKMLDQILAVYPSAIDLDDLGERTGFTSSGGTFATYLGNLRRNGLVEKRGHAVMASEILGGAVNG